MTKINNYTKSTFYEGLKGYKKITMLYFDVNAYVRIRRNKKNLVKFEILVVKDNNYFKYTEYAKGINFQIVNDFIDSFMLTGLFNTEYKRILNNRYKPVLVALRTYFMNFEICDKLQNI